VTELDLSELLLSDFNECLIAGSCDQLCINKEGTFDCQCVSGYKKSGHRCTAVNGMYISLANSILFFLFLFIYLFIYFIYLFIYFLCQ
jgi:hypothetical protein